LLSDPIAGSEDQYSELFRKIEQHVIDNCPNPDRIGCFSSDELKALVRHPEKFDLQDQKYVHIFRCAECAQEIKAFRDEYEAGRIEAHETQKQPVSSASFPKDTSGVGTLKSGDRFGLFTLLATAVASLCVGATFAWFLLRPHAGSLTGASASPQQTSEILDLSSFSTTRGVPVNSPQVVLFREAGSFLIELPPLSPAGKYHVALLQNDSNELVAADGSTRMIDGRTELPVSLPLTTLQPGSYRLAIRGDHDSAPYFYAARVR
jgi:hypothetical protein